MCLNSLIYFRISREILDKIWTFFQWTYTWVIKITYKMGQIWIMSILKVTLIILSTKKYDFLDHFLQIFFQFNFNADWLLNEYIQQLQGGFVCLIYWLQCRRTRFEHNSVFSQNSLTSCSVLRRIRFCREGLKYGRNFTLRR